MVELCPAHESSEITHPGSPRLSKPGIFFYDITTLLKDAQGIASSLIDALGAQFAGQGIDKVIGIEARGFIFAPAVAYALNAGFVPVRKPNNFLRRSNGSSTNSNTGRMRSRFTSMRFARASTC